MFDIILFLLVISPVRVKEEKEENLFAKKAGCQKKLQPTNAGYREHKHYMPKQLNQCQVSKH